ncbi:MAG: hypothetical protein ACYC5M_11795 [Anaerolineae bacterium]
MAVGDGILLGVAEGEGVTLAVRVGSAVGVDDGVGEAVPVGEIAPVRETTAVPVEPVRVTASVWAATGCCATSGPGDARPTTSQTTIHSHTTRRTIHTSIPATD